MWVNAHDEICLAILFGSYAKGTTNQNSDIDLGIQLLSGKALVTEQKLDYVMQLGELLSAEIDLVDLTTVGQPLLSQIMQYGKLLKGTPTDYTQLAITHINTAQDFLPYVERMLVARRHRWLGHG